MYVIKYNGILCSGYIRVALWGRNTYVDFKSESDNITWATKFRFNFIAGIVAFILQKHSDHNFLFHHYLIVKVNA